MNAVFEKIIQMSFSASFIILALCIMRMLFRRCPRWLICGLWVLAAIRLIFPFTFETEYSPVPSAQPIAQLVSVENEPEITLPSKQNILHLQGSNTATIDGDGNAVSDGASPSPILDNADNIISSKATASAEKEAHNNLRVFLPLIWLLGVAAVLTYGIVSYILLYRRSAPFIPVEGKVRESEFIFSPFILGVFRPKIYLPLGLSEPLRSHVLAHENAHLSRGDHFIKPIGFCILALHWFNPFVWLAYCLLSRDIELACDERVIRQMNSAARSSYAESLLNYYSGNTRVTRRLLNACPLAFGEVSMKKRIKAVVDFKRPAAWVIAFSLISAVLVGAMFFTNDVAISNAGEEQASKEQFMSTPVLNENDTNSELKDVEVNPFTDYRIIRLAERDSNESVNMELPTPSDIEKNFVLKGKTVDVKYNGVSYGRYEYTDSNGVKYYFSPEGYFCGYFDSWAYGRPFKEWEKTEVITEELAIERASSEGAAVFGELFTPLTKISTYQSSDGSWCVSFVEPLGKDGFASGYECSVDIGPMGGIASCKLNRYSELVDFDTSLLEDVAIDDISKVIREKITELYGKCPDLEFTLSEAFINRNEEGYFFSVGVSGTYTNVEATNRANRKGQEIFTRIDEWFFVYFE